jgi:hypothetical protein
VVVDNLKHEVLGYKMHGEEKMEEDVFVFDLDKSTPTHLKCGLYGKKLKSNPSTLSTSDDNFKKKEEEIEEKEKEEKTVSNETKVNNIILWIVCILLSLSIFEGVALIVSFKRTNNLEIFQNEIKQNIDSINNVLQPINDIIETSQEPSIENASDTLDINQSKATDEEGIDEEKSTDIPTTTN